MENKNKEPQQKKNQNSQNPINQIAENQQSAYGSKLDVRTNDYDVESKPGYENHVHPDTGAATDKVVAGGSGEKLPDLSKVRKQDETGGENQVKKGDKSLQDNDEGVAISIGE